MKLYKNQYRSLLSGIILCNTALIPFSSSFATANYQVSSTSISKSSSPVITDRLIVKYKNSSPEGSLAILSSNSMNRMSSIAGIEMNYMRQLSTGAQLLKIDSNLSADEVDKAILKLTSDPNVEYVERDLLLKPMAIPSDPRYNEQWHFFESVAGVNLPPAWDITQGQGAIVAVIDTGYLPHADLSANLLPGYDMITDTSVSHDGDGRDSNASDPGDWVPAGLCGEGEPARNSSWHGTHVAGILAALTNNSIGIAGIAHAAKIVPVRVLGRCGGYTSDIADGMIWAAGGNIPGIPINTNPANVLNLSLAGEGSCSPTQQAAINRVRGLKASVVVAAGNDNTDASNFTPANCNSVITVSAINRSGGKTNYSNYGSVVDIAAPGGEENIMSNAVLSTLNNGIQSPGGESYAFYHGTSMATPHVAGIAALLYSVDPAISPNKVEITLKNTSRAFTSTCAQCGTGIVDAATAVITAAGDITDPNELENGTPITGISGAVDEEDFFTLNIPAGASNLSIKMSSGTGDADLYVRFGAKPTVSLFDCRPYLNKNNETCNITNIQQGTYHVMIKGYRAYSGVKLTATYNE